MRRLLLFARRPLRGNVKTRLAPLLGEERCLELYRAFLHDQVAFLASLADRYEPELWLDGPWNASCGALPEADALRLREQGEGDLGRRLLRAFRTSHAEGAAATVVIGADSPTLPAAHVAGAFEALREGAAVVIAPAEDGGYVLLGLRQPQDALFREVEWGGNRVHETTLRRAVECGLSPVELPGWFDVDDADGMRRLREELARPSAAARAPATARVVADLG